MHLSNSRISNIFSSALLGDPKDEVLSYENVTPVRLTGNDANSTVLGNTTAWVEGNGSVVEWAYQIGLSYCVEILRLTYINTTEY
jgi:hypothetical protein